MKKISIIILALLAVQSGIAQDFQKNLSAARGAYQSGDLENARFAMEQMLHDLDIVIGKEIDRKSTRLNSSHT